MLVLARGDFSVCFGVLVMSGFNIICLSYSLKHKEKSNWRGSAIQSVHNWPKS